jgi:large subunit ribosomal protein L6
MSRVGKNPVAVPGGVDVKIDGSDVTVKGKLGELSASLAPEVSVSLEENQVWVKPNDDTKRARQMWGLGRSLVANMVQGVSEGFTKNLQIEGVGYRAAVEGKNLKLDLGFSHPINYPIPEGIKIACERPTAIAVSGADCQEVGQVASEIRSFRKPEPYKGKGIRYEGEYVRRKEGKKK